MTEKEKNDYFYVCSLIEYIARETKNRRGIVVRALGEQGIKKQLQDAEVLDEYADPASQRYECMCSEICRRQNFTSLRYHRLDDLVESIGLPKCRVCTYCFDGKE